MLPTPAPASRRAATANPRAPLSAIAARGRQKAPQLPLRPPPCLAVDARIPDGKGRRALDMDFPARPAAVAGHPGMHLVGLANVDAVEHCPAVLAGKPVQHDVDARLVPQIVQSAGAVKIHSRYSHQAAWQRFGYKDGALRRRIHGAIAAPAEAPCTFRPPPRPLRRLAGPDFAGAVEGAPWPAAPLATGDPRGAGRRAREGRGLAAGATSRNRPRRRPAAAAQGARRAAGPNPGPGAARHIPFGNAGGGQGGARAGFRRAALVRGSRPAGGCGGRQPTSTVRFGGSNTASQNLRVFLHLRAAPISVSPSILSSICPAISSMAPSSS